LCLGSITAIALFWILPISDSTDTVSSEDGAVKTLRVKNVKDSSVSELDVEGAFIYVGMIPNTDFLKGFIKLDESNYIIADRDTHTDIEGIFAAGDVRRKLSRQVATAVGDGATAAMAAEESMAGHAFK